MLADLMLCANFFIFTGGPGSGKTAVLNELNTRGYLTVSEVARSIIQKQQADGGDAIHTGNRKAFRDLMLEQSIADYCKMQSEEKIVFFDRGIPDLYGYSKAFCGEASKEVNEAVRQFRYNKTVFIFPPWPEIYENDDERQQDYQEALQTYYAVKEGYFDCGYVLLEVPKCLIKDRANFIFQMISKNG
ncbi:ATP-binding protein [Legionella pneumophila serogroup 1]